jgi:ATP-dependent helicase/nuclease subunit B
MSKQSADARALFEGAGPRVRTAPPGVGFLDLLADRLIAELSSAENSFALADALILTQNRRTARALIDVFSERGHAMLLPAIRPLADVEDDADVWGADPIALNVPPAIDDLRRRLELAQLIRAKDEAEGGVDDPAGAIAAADELCRLLDAASAAERVDWNALPALVEDRDLAQHWERSAKFLEIIAGYWPERLKNEGLADPAERRTLLLNALAESWTKRPPQSPVVIAGSTGSVAAVRSLMRVVAHLPRGCVILPGLDTDLDDEAWNEIEASHPQHGLKVTLDALGLDRRTVPTVLGAKESRRAVARRVLVREALAPAGRTADWLKRLEDAARPWGQRRAFVEEACAGLSLIEAQNEEEEATAIALLLRQALETPGRTAALVTPDARLGQRVAAKLSRWGVTASPSAGVALSDTPAGVLLTLLAELTEDDGLPVSLAALLKHPLAQFGSPAEISAFESDALRGPRKHRDLAHLRALLQADKDMQRSLPLLDRLAHALAPLREIFANGATEAGELADAMAEAAARVAGEGALAGRAGQAAALFLQSLAEAKGALGAIAPAQAPRLIATLLAGRVAQTEADSHPRLAIWGPLEARLQRRDLVILGGLNEGAWPAPPPDDPFLSRALRAQLGLGDAENRIGLAAHDFAQLANADEVVLTRAMRAASAPTVASRWIWRLDTLVKAADFNLRQEAPLAWARALDKPAKVTPARAPRPVPSAAGKFLPRLSVTDVEKLIRDPYAVYAKRILGLEQRRPIGAPVDPRDLGNAIHKALELFTPNEAPADEQLATLLALLDAQLLAFGYADEMRAALRSRLKGAACDFIGWAGGRVKAGVTPYLERLGELAVDGVTLSGRADRVEIGADGRAEIIDFKSGGPPTDNQVNSGLAPQLLLEAAMLKAGVFEDVPKAETDALVYWRFAGTRWGPRVVKLEGGDVAASAQEALDGLKRLLAHYAGPQGAFLSKPRVEFLTDVDDFDHLARRKEWAATEDSPF